MMRMKILSMAQLLMCLAVLLGSGQPASAATGNDAVSSTSSKGQGSGGPNADTNMSGKVDTTKASLEAIADFGSLQCVTGQCYKDEFADQGCGGPGQDACMTPTTTAASGTSAPANADQ